jgi:YbbR domain-containing protein
VDRLLNNDLAVKIIAVLVAIVLWFQVTGQGLGGQVQRVVRGVSVSWRNVPSDLAVASVYPESVSVTVLGSRNVIDALTGSDFGAVANLSNAQPGRQSFYVDITVPRGVSFVGVDPNNVTVVLEQIIEREENLSVVVHGTPAASYRAGAPAAAPPQVIARGTVAALARVATVRAVVDVSGATADVRAQAVPVALDARGQAVKGVQILPQKVDVTVPVTRVLPTATLPVSVAVVGRPAAGYRVAGSTASPATVSVAAPRGVLDSLHRISTQPVDVSGARSDVSALAPLVLPDGVMSAAPAVVRVQIHVRRQP